MSKPTWRTSPRPTNWTTTRRRILQRDRGICYVCGQPGADAVDHIVPACRGGSDDDSNLAAIHSKPCHTKKTSAEAQARNWTTRRRRESEPHPGRIEP